MQPGAGETVYQYAASSGHDLLVTGRSPPLFAGLVQTTDPNVIVIYERPETWDWVLWWAGFLAFGYLLGSIPFGYL